MFHMRERCIGSHAKIKFEEGVRTSLEWLWEKSVRRRIVKKYSDMLDMLYKEYGFM